MVNGLENFKKHFEKFNGKYTLIGGVACELLLDDAGLDFRATREDIELKNLHIRGNKDEIIKRIANAYLIDLKVSSLF